MSLPSSVSKNKPRKNQRQNRWQAELCFLVSSLTYSLILKMEVSCSSPKRRFTYNGLHDVISQKIQLFICYISVNFVRSFETSVSLYETRRPIPEDTLSPEEPQISQGILCLLSNSDVHYRVNKSPLLESILSLI
jgi:hypothetical protein